MSSKHTTVTLQALLAITLLAAAVAAGQTPAQQAAVDLARKTLAEQLRTAPEGLEVVAVEAARWGGAVFDCRSARVPSGEPGIPGYLVRLRLDDDTFAIRVGQERAILCGINDFSHPAQPERGTVERGLVARSDQARADLAKRLQVSTEKIEVLDAISVVWRDSSVGCPRPGMDYMPVLTPGFRIRLRAGLGIYAYHGRRGGAPSFCKRPSAVEPLRSEVE